MLKQQAKPQSTSSNLLALAPKQQIANCNKKWNHVLQQTDWGWNCCVGNHAKPMQNASQTCQKTIWKHKCFYVLHAIPCSIKSCQKEYHEFARIFKIMTNTDISTLHQSVRPSIWKKWCCLYRSTPLPWLTVAKVFWLQVASRNKLKLFHGGTTQLLLFPCHGYNIYSLPQFSQLGEIWCVACCSCRSAFLWHLAFPRLVYLGNNVQGIYFHSMSSHPWQNTQKKTTRAHPCSLYQTWISFQFASFFWDTSASR